MAGARALQRYVDDGSAGVAAARLLVLLYERLDRDLEVAAEAVVEGRIPEAHEALVHAQAIVFELDIALDVEVWDGAHALRRIYRWLDSELIIANMHKDVVRIRGCRSVVGPLLEAWTSAQ